MSAGMLFHFWCSCFRSLTPAVYLLQALLYVPIDLSGILIVR